MALTHLPWASTGEDQTVKQNIRRQKESSRKLARSAPHSTRERKRSTVKGTPLSLSDRMARRPREDQRSDAREICERASVLRRTRYDQQLSALRSRKTPRPGFRQKTLRARPCAGNN